MIHRYRKNTYEYAPSQHQFLMRRWYDDLGVPFSLLEVSEYDSVTRVVTAGAYQVVAKTPPPWIRKGS